MTKPHVRRFALRIAGELRARSTTTPRTYLFLLRDDKSLRVIDQTVSTGRRVLTFEAYRGSAAVLGHYPVVRFDGPADAVWFGDGISARDEGNALTVIENAIVTQLEGADFARHDADETVDVREGSEGAAYEPRFRPVDYARVLARGSLLVAFWSFTAAWIAFAAAGVWGASQPPSPAVSAVAVVGLLLPHLLAVIAVMVAGFAGRSGNGTRTMVLALAAFVWVPLAAAGAAGPFLAVIGGVLLAAAAASAAAVPVWLPAGAFAVIGAAAAFVGVLLIASAPAAAAAVIGAGMIVATVAAALIIRGSSVRAATR